MTVKEIKDRLSKHIIPYEEMVRGDYVSFLKERAKLVHRKMLEVCRAVPDHDEGSKQ